MKGKIDIDGRLFLDKGNGILINQMCPYEKECPCGLWCPVFNTNYFEHIMPNGRIWVKLCNGATIYFDKEEKC